MSCGRAFCSCASCSPAMATRPSYRMSQVVVERDAALSGTEELHVALAAAHARQQIAVAITIEHAREQGIQALALRGWARSVRRRDRRLRFEAVMLREQAQSLRLPAAWTAAVGPAPADKDP